MDIKGTIVNFIISNFPEAREWKNLDDVSLVDEGIIDSVGELELVAFLEETFTFSVEDEEITSDNLDSVNKLVIYVQSKITTNIS